MSAEVQTGSPLRARVYRILEGTPDRPSGRIVRIGLAALILLNVAAVIVESVEEIGTAYASAFWWFELFSVAVFTLEYALRLWSCVEDPRYTTSRRRFALTPMALVDVVAVLPFYLGALMPVDTRMLRSLRLLRIFKLSRHSSSLDLLLTVIRQEASSILSSMFIMIIVIVLAASGIYWIERGAQPALDSIPKAMWWAAVTLTTVGYGDIVPVTVLGKVFGLLITVAGVGMVALPAGILASGFSLELQRRREAYRLQVKDALADGTVSHGDSVRLENQRDELGLSEAEAALVLRSERLDRPQPSTVCPHCGKSVDP